MTYHKTPSALLGKGGKLYSAPCVPCQKETPHRHSKCLYCNSLSSPAYVGRKIELKERSKNLPFGIRLKERAVWNHKLNRARREAEARSAAEARKKLGVTE